MKNLCFIAFLLGSLPAVIFAQSGPYSRVQFNATPQIMQELASRGVALDHLSTTDKGYIGEFSKEETLIIKNICIDATVLISDLTQHFLQNNKSTNTKRQSLTYTTPSGFKLGSMGGYLTLLEADTLINSMIKKYPLLISKKDTIGFSLQGRPIYALRVSDNPNVDENEPEVLYTALHHAREPMSLMQMIYYLYYVLENYGKDAEITAIVKNREMYFVPFINPDGYYFNQMNNPNGGGFWRKNLRKNADSTYGVDLNRNYGYGWGFNNTGSSPVGSSETYRGDSAFSEPETQAIRNYCNKRHFIRALNYHTYGNHLLYPWGKDTGPTTAADSTFFKALADTLTIENAYQTGTCMQTLKYTVNGSSDDWMYGEQMKKNKILAYTPEVGDGTYGFWPPMSQILPDCDINIRQNINLVLMGLKVTPIVGLESLNKIVLNIYPNPSEGIIVINGLSDPEAKLMITNDLGQQIYAGLISRSGIVDLSFLPNGIYHCHIAQAGNDNLDEKLVILK